MVTLSGYGTEEDHRRSREAGCDTHLVKPVDPDVLLGVLSA
jgi:two-component system CheB/CheR fusion protein